MRPPACRGSGSGVRELLETAVHAARCRPIDNLLFVWTASDTSRPSRSLALP
jgi:hypothetical protein